MKILRIGGTIAIVIDVCQSTILESHVGVVAQDRYPPEVPPGFDLLFFGVLFYRIDRIFSMEKGREDEENGIQEEEEAKFHLYRFDG